MANALYPFGKEAILGARSWSSDDFRVVLTTSAYTYNAAHQYHSDLTGILATSANLAGKTLTNGTADASDLTITGITGTVARVIIVRWSGASGTSELIAYFDTGVGFGVVLAAEDLLISWSNASNRIFSL